MKDMTYSTTYTNGKGYAVVQSDETEFDGTAKVRAFIHQVERCPSYPMGTATVEIMVGWRTVLKAQLGSFSPVSFSPVKGEALEDSLARYLTSLAERHGRKVGATL